MSDPGEQAWATGTSGLKMSDWKLEKKIRKGGQTFPVFVGKPFLSLWANLSCLCGQTFSVFYRIKT